MPHLDFEYKKCVSFIFTNMFSILKYHTVKYIRNHPKILFALLSKYRTNEWDVAFNYGIMLRQCIQHEVLTKTILKSNEFLKMFEYFGHPSVEIALDVFSTLCDLLTIHKEACAEYFKSNYEIFFIQHFHWILNTDNYLLQRLSLKLLRELLFDSHNVAVMKKFVYNTDMLKIILTKLTAINQRVRLEAFHIFKLFLVSLYESNGVYYLIYCYRKQLINILRNLPTNNDQVLSCEIFYLVNVLQTMKSLKRCMKTKNDLQHPNSI